MIPVDFAFTATSSFFNLRLDRSRCIKHAPSRKSRSLYAAFQIQYFLASSSAILVYDYLLTIRLEIELVWLSPFNWISIVYLIQRYLPFVDTLGASVLFLYGIYNPTLSTGKCDMINHLGLWLHIIGITLSEIVLATRAYAACQVRFSKRPLLITFSILAALFWIPFWVTGNIGHGEGSPGNFCAMHSHSSQPFFFLTYVCAAAHGIAMLTMMIIAGYPTYKAKQDSGLFRVVYGDSIVYYATLIFVIFANVVVMFTAPVNFVALLMPLTRVVHATLTSRTLLHIRETMARKVHFEIDMGALNLDMGADEREMSTIHFNLEGGGPIYSESRSQ
ncbi:hypothetical protein E1B28_003118 [Marasmius oreades]|uniref:DUF6533 domain-containing protein n=1 Tax=Marasmius oreades TaxID=181124 RepID=A0A9P7UJ93_9AGAR|nr:uncharacterized protein E1B28_003118 [Marasmius oreades]KAG7085562.1 hypothetical protein E1B28_003118 [Marasmius oreades]